MPTIIKGIESIANEYRGSDLQEKIRAYIQDCHRKWGSNLYILLGGDTNIIPSRLYHEKGSSFRGTLTYFPTDAYYASLLGDWNTNKNNIFAERGLDSVSLGRQVYIGRAPVENIAEGETFVNKVLASLNGAGHSGLGQFHIVYHEDHCCPQFLGTSGVDKNQAISIQDVDFLDNGGYPQIIFSGGCEPAEFNKDCIAEHFLNNPNYGAVAFIGNANVGWVGEHDEFLNVLNALYNTNNYNLGMLHFSLFMGDANYPTLSFDKTPYHLRNHLLGDPEMPVWSAVPQHLNVVVTPQQAIWTSPSLQGISCPMSAQSL